MGAVMSSSLESLDIMQQMRGDLVWAGGGWELTKHFKPVFWDPVLRSKCRCRCLTTENVQEFQAQGTISAIRAPEDFDGCFGCEMWRANIEAALRLTKHCNRSVYGNEMVRCGLMPSSMLPFCSRDPVHGEPMPVPGWISSTDIATMPSLATGTFANRTWPLRVGSLVIAIFENVDGETWSGKEVFERATELKCFLTEMCTGTPFDKKLLEQWCGEIDDVSVIPYA